MEPRKVQGRLSRSAHGSNRRKSRSRRKGNRRETEKSAQTNEGHRSGFRAAKKSGRDRRKEENDSQISRQKSAPCQESSMRWIGLPEDDAKKGRGRRKYQAARPHA